MNTKDKITRLIPIVRRLYNAVNDKHMVNNIARQLICISLELIVNLLIEIRDND